MSDAPLRELTGEVEGAYRLLLEEATALLQNFDSAAPEDFDRIMARRAEIMASLQSSDAEIGESLAGAQSPPGRDEAAALESLRSFREETTRRIIEIDSIVMALARERLDRLQQEMGALGRGKVALHGYESSGRERSSKLNSTA